MECCDSNQSASERKWAKPRVCEGVVSESMLIPTLIYRSKTKVWKEKVGFENKSITE